MGRNIGNVVASINELVAELGLEKLSAADDPGTAHPAKQEAGKSNIQAATEGARSAENVADNKEQVTGQSIAEASPGDAKAVKSESAGENITTATYTGEDPKVEKGYVKNVTDPGTTHPAKAEGKTAEVKDLAKCAEAVLAEIKTLNEFTVKDAAEARVKIASMVEAPENKKEAAVDENVTEYIKGYTKSAALVGELTADMLDGMSAALAKKADDEEKGESKSEGKSEKKEKKAEPEPTPDAGGPPAGAPPAGPDAGAPGAPGGDGMDEQAAALAQAAAEIAQELGVSPEEVLQMAEAELAQQGGGAPGAGGPPMGGPPMGGAGVPPGMEIQGSAKESDEIKELRKKAVELDALKAKQAEEEAEDKQRKIVKKAVASALEQFMAERKEQPKA